MAEKRKCIDCGLARRELQGEENKRRRVCIRCQRAKRRVTARRFHVFETYGLTVHDHDRLLAYQDGRCAICKGTRPYNLAVEHCHASGMTRGLACKRCNKLLRDVRDDVSLLRAAIEYLTNPPAQRIGVVALAPSAKRETE